MTTATMASTNKRINAQWDRARKLFSSALVDRLESRGAAFWEDKREDSRIFDENGEGRIDCYSGAGSYNLGRKNRALLTELRTAANEIDQGNFIMISEEKALFGKRLDEFLPGNLECVLPGVVRGEGIDAACKLARGYTGRAELITVDGGWYGQTGFAMTLSQRDDKDLYGSLIPEVKTIPFGDIETAKKAISRRTAAFILEPVQVENHCRSAAVEYLREVRKLCRKKGAMLVLDETQTGFGRTGSKFAYERYAVIPDILVYGEAVTGGVFPMTGMAFTRTLKSFFDAHPLIHMCTFGGNDVGCRVAIRAMDEYDRLKPWQNALLLGEKLLDDTKAVMKKYPDKIKSINGVGLLVSLEFKDEIDSHAFCALLSKNGIFASPGEVARQCVVLRPSLLVTSDDIDAIVKALYKAAALL